MEAKTNKKDLVKFITQNPESPIAQILLADIPQNNMEYLEMWEPYYIYLKTDKDLFKHLISSWGNNILINDLQFRYEIWKEVKEQYLENLNYKIENLSFKPRADMYAETFSDEESTEIRSLLLYFLCQKPEKYTNDQIMEVGEGAGLSMRWLLSLTAKHRLFTDGVLEIDERFGSDSKVIQEQDIMMNFTTRKIFSGLELTDSDIISIKDSPLIEMFGLADSSDIQSLLKNSDDESDIKDNDFGIDWDDEEEEDDEEGRDSENVDIEQLLSKLEDEQESIDDSHEQSEDDHPEKEELEEDDITPFKNDLDFLYQEFLWIKKRAELVDDKFDSFSIDRDDKKKLIHIEQEYRRLKNVSELRLRKSKQQGFVPRLILLSRELNLNELELNIIKALTVNQIFLVEKPRGHSSDSNIGELLLLLLEDVHEAVKHRRLFLKNAKLVKHNIIYLDRSGLEDSFFETKVTIDNRLVEKLVGEDYDISNYVDGSYLYSSNIKFENVKLPNQQKEELLSLVDNFPSFLKAKNQIEFAPDISYGDSLVMLFIGASGTGKTMEAHALANYLNKKLLVFDLNNLSGMGYMGRSDEAIFSMLFREARMNEAILFFDEAEDLLSNRFNDLLQEIEKHKGIVIFATNASFRVDEALRRRINFIQHFQEPGPQLRKQIWHMHLPEKITLAEDVDLNHLALRYEINGGLIKNAVFSALAKAVGENNSENPVITMKHLSKGAEEQLRNKLFMSKLEKQKTPKKGFDDAVYPEETLKDLQEIAEFDKATKVMEGEWGFKDVFPEMGGLTALFHGKPGTGKTLAAEILAYETGKPIKEVNYSQVVSKYIGETEKALEALFSELADSNSILLFDEADALFARRTEVASVNDRFANTETDVLLSLIEKTNTIAILTTNYMENIDEAFHRRMTYIVEFPVPDVATRELLWNILLPPKLPVEKDIDFKKLAKRFVFTGGDIKNAIIRAASIRAVKLNGTSSVTMKDFEEACARIEEFNKNKREGIGF